MRTRCQRSRTDRGFTLIIVLWLTALLALLAAGFSLAVRSHLRLAANATQSAKAEAAADAGVQLAALSLIAGRQSGAQSRRFPIDGTAQSCALDGQASLTIQVQDAGGRININLANERLLQALFIGLGASRERASSATDAIIDYRDADSDRRPNGAEKPEYLAAGRPLGPKNAPFDTIEELNQVLGLDPEMIARASPFITVHSQTAGLDPRGAKPELAALLARGAAELPAKPGPASSIASGLPAEFVVGSPQRVFHVRSQARLPAGAVYVRETVVELPSSSAAMPVFKMWKRGVAEDGAVRPEGGGLPPC